MERPDLRDDDGLTAALAELFDRDDPPPADAVAAAEALIELRNVDAELAELVADSLLDANAPSMRHEGRAGRVLVFQAGAVTVELEIGPDEALLVGQLDPPRAVVIEVEGPTGRSRVDSDRLGRFHCDLPAGMFRVRVGDDTASVETPWISR